MPNHTIYLSAEVTKKLETQMGDSKSRYISALIVKDEPKFKRLESKK